MNVDGALALSVESVSQRWIYWGLEVVHPQHEAVISGSSIDQTFCGHKPRSDYSAIPNLNGLKLGVEPIFDSNDAKPAENCNNPSTMCKFEPTKSNQVVKIGKQLATFGIAGDYSRPCPPTEVRGLRAEMLNQTKQQTLSAVERWATA